MRKLRDVCRIVGVSRRTLQGYDEIGLLHPTAKTEKGYWLYDDTAVKKLILIQLFIETGYERKRVKQLLEAPMLDLMEEFNHVIARLEDKRKRIDAMIDNIKKIKLIARLPEETLKALGSMDVATLYKEKSFSDYWKETVDEAPTDSNDDEEEFELYSRLIYHLAAIGLLHDKPVDSPEVVANVELLFDYLYHHMDMLLENEKSENSSDAIGIAIIEILAEPEAIDLLETLSGGKTASYVIKAVKHYCNTLKEEN